MVNCYKQLSVEQILALSLVQACRTLCRLEVRCVHVDELADPAWLSRLHHGQTYRLPSAAGPRGQRGREAQTTGGPAVTTGDYFRIVRACVFLRSHPRF